MPRLLRSSEAAGCGATIELDNGEVVYVSIAQTGVLVRLWNMKGGLIKSIISNFLGPKLYNESVVYKNAEAARALSLAFPDEIPSLNFRNPVLAAFANAIWHCSSAAEVSIILNEAATKPPPSAVALQEAFDAANNWPPKRPPELNPATYQVIYSDGVNQETRLTPDEINSWAAASNEDAEGKFPYRILRIIDASGKVVWTK
jgi:hypothetical protein